MQSRGNADMNVKTISLLFLGCTFANAFGDDRIELLKLKGEDEAYTLKAYCLERDASSRCTELKLEARSIYPFSTQICRGYDRNSKEISEHLEKLTNRSYTHPDYPLYPGFNFANAAAAHTSGDALGKLGVFILVSPVDIIGSPVEAAAYGASVLSVHRRIHRSIRMLEDFIKGIPIEKSAPRFSNRFTFESIIENVFTPPGKNPSNPCESI